MKNLTNAICRPAKIKFKNNTEEEGLLIYTEPTVENGEVLYPYFKIRLNDANKTEKAFDYWNIDIITFL